MDESAYVIRDSHGTGQSQPAPNPGPNSVPMGESSAMLICAEEAADPVAGEVARGIRRLFARNNIWCVEEMPLGNGRRADLAGIDARGQVVIVEIKVARGDLLGDGKWPDYLSFCDRFYWGVPPGLDRAPLETPGFEPEKCGVIVADGYDAQIVRQAPLEPLAAARRKKVIESLARTAMRRITTLADPLCLDVAGAQ